mmetsp:Transcript_47198/g.102666  ORF Transcript_47198/g.102666 Transcript_47198/m.102666 type:complete len:212 (-) Transcript_47198:674-1309(-)
MRHRLEETDAVALRPGVEASDRCQGTGVVSGGRGELHMTIYRQPEEAHGHSEIGGRDLKKALLFGPMSLCKFLHVLCSCKQRRQLRSRHRDFVALMGSSRLLASPTPLQAAIVEQSATHARPLRRVLQVHLVRRFPRRPVPQHYAQAVAEHRGELAAAELHGLAVAQTKDEATSLLLRQSCLQDLLRFLNCVGIGRLKVGSRHDRPSGTEG